MTRTTLTPVQRALAHFDDSPTKMAAAIGAGVLRQHVEHWRLSGRIPTEHCRAVHDITSVKCWELRPADWHRIWPELIGKKGAPPVPPPQAEKGAESKSDAAPSTAPAARSTLRLKHKREALTPTDKPSNRGGR